MSAHTCLSSGTSQRWSQGHLNKIQPWHQPSLLPPQHARLNARHSLILASLQLQWQLVDSKAQLLGGTEQRHVPSSVPSLTPSRMDQRWMACLLFMPPATCSMSAPYRTEQVSSRVRQAQHRAGAGVPRFGRASRSIPTSPVEIMGLFAQLPGHPLTTILLKPIEAKTGSSPLPPSPLSILWLHNA